MAMTETLKAIADPVRRRILELLHTRSYSAGELASQFDLKPATVSYHLKLLKQAGLIAERREKNFIYYDLNASVFDDVVTWIYSLGGKSDEN